MSYEYTYVEPLNAEETEMLYRIVCLGVNSGDPVVRSKLYTKIAKAKENAQLGRAWISTRDILEMQRHKESVEKGKRERV